MNSIILSRMVMAASTSRMYMSVSPRPFSASAFMTRHITSSSGSSSWPRSISSMAVSMACEYDSMDSSASPKSDCASARRPRSSTTLLRDH